MRLFLFFMIFIGFTVDFNEIIAQTKFESFFNKDKEILFENFQLSGANRLIEYNSNLIFADLKQSQIVEFDNDGRLLQKFGRKGRGPGEFLRIIGLSLDNENHFYVYDSSQLRISKFDENGNHLKDFGIDFRGHQMKYFDEKLYLYSSFEFRDNSKMIHVFDANTGEEVNAFAEPTQQIANMGLPLSGLLSTMDIDHEGNIYVTHPFDYTIRKYSPDGSFSDELSAANRLFTQPDAENYQMPGSLEEVAEARLFQFFVNRDIIFIVFRSIDNTEEFIEIIDRNDYKTIHDEPIKIEDGTPIHLTDEYLYVAKFFKKENNNDVELGLLRYEINL